MQSRSAPRKSAFLRVIRVCCCCFCPAHNPRLLFLPLTTQLSQHHGAVGTEGDRVTPVNPARQKVTQFVRCNAFQADADLAGPGIHQHERVAPLVGNDILRDGGLRLPEIPRAERRIGARQAYDPPIKRPRNSPVG